MAEDEALPADFRRATLDLARESTILSHPARVRLMTADRATTEGLRNRFDQVSARLLTA